MDRIDWIAQHPRFLADITGNGRADIVGLGRDGVYASLNTRGDGVMQISKLVLRGFGQNAGGWRVDQHPRFPADVLYLSMALPLGTLCTATLIGAGFSISATVHKGSWRSVCHREAQAGTKRHAMKVMSGRAGDRMASAGHATGIYLGTTFIAAAVRDNGRTEIARRGRGT